MSQFVAIDAGAVATESKTLDASGWKVESLATVETDTFWKMVDSRPEVKSVRFSDALFEEVMARIHLQSPDLITTGSADCLYRERSGWWSTSLLRRGLIWGAGQVGKVDIRKSALFCGDSRSVGAIMSAFVHVGYSNVYWYSGEETVDESVLAVFHKNHFGAQVHHLNLEAFRMLGPVCSMVVVKTRQAPSKVLVEEMNYFNYFSPGGVLFDANWEMAGAETFDKQVQGEAFHFVPSKTVRQWVDLTWVEGLKSGRCP